MSKQKPLTYLFVLLSILNALGIIFPEVIDKKLVTFLPFPVLILLYLFSVKKVNILYFISLLATFCGIVLFNTASYFEPSLIFYAIGVCLYVVIVLKTAVVISMRSILMTTIPFLIVYLVPLFYYYDSVQTDIFNYIMFYVFFVGLFFFVSGLVYVNQRNTKNLWLLNSGIVFLISTVIHGYYIFSEKLVSIRVAIVFTFLFMHYAMYRYIITK
ncbi:hypothetical protein [uncultured Kordia sp.]|uniref:hypothetical protein n=1 Tax=uncultured Kordia sp. TaxID=507699 RepID=UPI002619BCBC|nr:hypothetical protein [uncultured Kordia sp.]